MDASIPLERDMYSLIKKKMQKKLNKNLIRSWLIFSLLKLSTGFPIRQGNNLRVGESHKRKSLSQRLLKNPYLFEISLSQESMKMKLSKFFLLLEILSNFLCQEMTEEL
jgi:hypothetical protein